jgi:hypothetical protein
MDQCALRDRRRLSGPRIVQAVTVAVGTVLAAACGSGSTPVDPGPGETNTLCTVGAAACTSRVQIGSGVYLEIYSTYELDLGKSSITRAVIVVHGAGRDADGTFETMVDATGRGSSLTETIVIAPFFQTSEDLPRPDEVYWSSSGWKKGHLSRTEGPSPRISSFEAIDVIVAKLADRSRFPALEEIVIAGHSAGGQVAHRYVAGSRAEDVLQGIGMRYVVANPSTYLYLGPERWDGAGFSVPDPAPCPDYQIWHYGLTDLNTYMNRSTIPEVEERMMNRDVTILVGSADTGLASLDVSCGANLQGDRRFDRGQKLVDFMDALRPGHNHVERIVPGVAHSSSGMYSSTVGLQVLFPG